jgi:hypothetical protein
MLTMRVTTKLDTLFATRTKDFPVATLLRESISNYYPNCLPETVTKPYQYPQNNEVHVNNILELHSCLKGNTLRHHHLN